MRLVFDDFDFELDEQDHELFPQLVQALIGNETVVYIRYPGPLTAEHLRALVDLLANNQNRTLSFFEHEWPVTLRDEAEELERLLERNRAGRPVKAARA